MTKENFKSLYKTHELYLLCDSDIADTALEAMWDSMLKNGYYESEIERKVFKLLHYDIGDFFSSAFSWSRYSTGSEKTWSETARLAMQRKSALRKTVLSEDVVKYVKYDGCPWYQELDKRYLIQGSVYYRMRGTDALINIDSSIMTFYDELPDLICQYKIGDVIDYCTSSSSGFGVIKDIRRRTVGTYQVGSDWLVTVTPYHCCDVIYLHASDITGLHSREVPSTTLQVGDIVRHKRTKKVKLVMEVNTTYFPPKVTYNDESKDYGVVSVEKVIGWYYCEYCLEFHDGASISRMSVEGHDVCTVHASDALYSCVDCGESVFRSKNMTRATEYQLCTDCLLRHTHNCAQCGDVCCDLDSRTILYVPTSGERAGRRLYFCSQAHKQTWLTRNAVERYGYKPSPVFHPVGQVGYLGVELEVDDGDIMCASKLLENAKDYYYLKRDGSLGDSGIEIVTHPCTLEHHKKEFPWLFIMRLLAKYGYTSYRNRTCGLHIHASRTLFGATNDEQWYTVAKVILFIERNWWKVLKFSRRRNESSYASCNHLFDSLPYDLTDTRGILDVVQAQRVRRHLAINVQNSNTIEFRLFKGTSNRNTLLACLEFVDAIIKYATDRSISDCNAMDGWNLFINSLDKMQYQYLVRLNNKLIGGNN